MFPYHSDYLQSLAVAISDVDILRANCAYGDGVAEAQRHYRAALAALDR